MPWRIRPPEEGGDLAYWNIVGSAGQINLWRHSTGLNVLFCDGHVEWKGRKTFVPLDNITFYTGL
jgi:prepilin-type processing-associated H-X9-DG protein